MGDEHRRIAETMRQINDAWIAGRVDNLAPMVHDEIVMVMPGFAGRVQGRETFIAGFRDFCENARIHDFRDGERQIDVVGDTAVVNFDYEMLYERSAARYRVTGRDLWVFARHGTEWLAVWRTMLDLSETPA